MPPSLLSAVPPGHWTDYWFLVLPLLAGAGAVYLLLPRPEPYPSPWGALLAGLALLLAGALVVRVGALTVETLLFYAFSAVAVVAGGLLVTQRNPARAALSFALVILSTCGLFLLLAAPFLMAATVIIYAGAIVVTFLFVIMLAQQSGLGDADARSREPFLATATGFVLLGALLYVLHLSYGTGEGDPPVRDIDDLLRRTREAEAARTADEVRRVVAARGPEPGLLEAYKKVLEAHGLRELRDGVEERIQQAGSFDFETADFSDMKKALAQLEEVGVEARRHITQRLAALQPHGTRPLSNLSGPPPTVPPEDLRRDDEGRPHLPHENSAYLGKSLFTDYLLPVELGGVLLLVATVGAIAIAHRRGPQGRAS